MEKTASRRQFLAALPLAAALAAACTETTADKNSQWQAFDARGLDVDHSGWDEFLGRYVHPSPDGINRVAYAAVTAADRGMLLDYVLRMQKTEVAALDRKQQFAFWVNLYNAATVQTVVENYPVESIRDIGGVLKRGPWQDAILSIAGTSLSLDDIEHRILRPIWRDVRIHYAVNCASLGCPNLARRAFTAQRMESMLEAAAADYVNHPRGFQEIDGELIASSIYDWYQGDWGSEQSVLAHARVYASGSSAAMLGSRQSIDGYDYDWTLNEQK